MEQNYKKYIRRCIDIALNGKGNTGTNPMVGCVLVYNDRVIGEGFHEIYGGPHAEVNAINSVKDKSLLKKCTIYVSLEPCAHTGKTPPCSDLIIENKIPKVVIGSRDPNSLVAGKGIQKLLDANIEVVEGILEKECMAINNRFFTYHSKKRPYIILKWAQSADGFLDIDRKPGTPVGPNWISNPVSRMLVHKWRSEEKAILSGTNTVENDNPSLTTRLWPGQSPLRVILDRKLRLESHLQVFNADAPTIIFNELKSETVENLTYLKIDFSNHIEKTILTHLWERGIQSVIIEGGKRVLQSFIDKKLWDEARVFQGTRYFKQGLNAPDLSGNSFELDYVLDDTLLYYKNNF